MKKFHLSVSGSTMEEDLKYVTFQLDRFITRTLRPLGFGVEQQSVSYGPAPAAAKDDVALAEQDAMLETIKWQNKQLQALGAEVRDAKATILTLQKRLSEYAAEITDLTAKAAAPKKKAPAKKKVAAKKAAPKKKAK